MEATTKNIYYRITFRLKSPLALGSGENTYTDKDLIKDAQGNPYIPASSIAGVVRSGFDSDADFVRYFGDVKKAGKNSEAENIESRIIFHDAILCGKGKHITVRDSVALDEFKTAKDGAKFDMEALETDAEFVTWIEQVLDENYPENYAGKVAAKFAAGLTFGGKSMRGYGDIGVTKIERVEFDMSDPASVDQWLDFDLYGDVGNTNGWTDVTEEMKKDAKMHQPKTIRLKLKQEGGISIRRYTTSKDESDHLDMKQLTSHFRDDDTEKWVEEPVIPGTSWAGAFRHRMSEFAPEEIKGNFGYVGGANKNDKQRSMLRFSESHIIGAKDKAISRNAIDRFSGGTVDGALFTERTYYGGTTELDITWVPLKKDDKMSDKAQKALAAAITDLHFGFLAVGGETSIGRGLFSVEAINDRDVKGLAEDAVYQTILKEVQGVMGS